MIVLVAWLRRNRSRTDPPEYCHLNVKKLPKPWHFFQKNKAKNCLFFLNWEIECQKVAKNLTFFQNNCQKIIIFSKIPIFVNFLEKMSCFWQFFDIQTAIFRRVRWVFGRCIPYGPSWQLMVIYLHNYCRKQRYWHTYKSKKSDLLTFINLFA